MKIRAFVDGVMYETIKNFNTQFSFEPKVENGENLAAAERYIVAGMGGSHLAADLLKVWKPEMELVAHSDYGLPAMTDNSLVGRLMIASSYSGNTEEAIDAFLKAGGRNLPRAAITVGGKLKELAKAEKAPYIELPDTGIQPRMAAGFSFRALLKLMGEEPALEDTARLAYDLRPSDFEDEGKKLAGRLNGKAPIIYASARNRAIAENWKIKFNETGKIPAFFNVFPELNHNEMTGFDITESTKGLSENFYILILRDSADHPKVLRRMEVTAELYRKKGLPAEIIPIGNENVFLKIFSALILADWASYYTAKTYGAEPEQVLMVEEFKKIIG